MTTPIKLTRKLGGHDAGTTITVTNGTAEHLTANGYAEAIGTKTTRAKKTTTDTTPGGDSPHTD